jgi:hypothetical protein
MTNHRSSHDRVPNQPPRDNLRASDVDVIEDLHAAILRIATLAQVASDAVDHLVLPSPPAARRAFARMQILVSKAADEASAALAQADKWLAELTGRPKIRTDQQLVAPDHLPHS